MKLDLYRNELVFSSINDKITFAQHLQRAKDLEYRAHKGKYYISLAHFYDAQRVLKSFGEKISPSIKYEKFAHKFVVTKQEVIIDWYPNECYVSGKGMPWEKIIPQTSYFTKKALQSEAYKKGQWDGTVHLFNVYEGKFPSGLLERIVKALRASDTPYTVNKHFEYPEPYIDLNPEFPFEPTEDQKEAVEALDKFGHGIAKLPTGFGKTSYVAAALIARKGVRAMFLANQRVLINDAKDDFREVFKNDDVKIGTIGDGEFDPGDITVASIQGIKAALTPPSHMERQDASLKIDKAERSGDEKEIKKAHKRMEKLQNRVERAELIKPFLQDIDLFIVDESQVLGTDMWKAFLEVCPAPFRYTLSATDTRTDGGRIEIVAATGERRYESSAEDQIKKGRLSEFRGHFRKFDHGLPKELVKDLKLEYHQAYDLFIVDNRPRNEHLVDKLIEWAMKDNSVLGLVTRRRHAEVIEEMLREKNIPEHVFEYVDGQTPVKERKENIERFRNGEFPILLGTSIFDVGFNAKNASKIVRFNAGGSEVREPQRAGRTVRKRDDDSWGESYDILDINVPFFEAQGWKRMKFLRQEFGDKRVILDHDVIKGEFDVSRLDEVVAAIPDETDRQASQEVLDNLAKREELFNVEEPDLDLSGIEADPDLKSIMEELKKNTP